MQLVALDAAQTIGDMDVPDFKLHTFKGKLKERWLAMQDHYDLWQTRQHAILGNVQHIEFIAA